MARGYFKMKDKQAAEALDEASIGLILSQTMGPLAVQMLPLLEMQAPLQACQRPGRSVPEILDIVAQANAALKGLPSKTALVSARAKSVADSRLTTKKVPPRNKSSLPPVMSPKGRVQRGSNTPVVVPEVQVWTGFSTWLRSGKLVLRILPLRLCQPGCCVSSGSTSARRAAQGLPQNQVTSLNHPVPLEICRHG